MSALNHTVHTIQKQKVINSTKEAFDHYTNGNGESVKLSKATLKLLKSNPKFREKLQRITKGISNNQVTAKSGSFSINMTKDMFHVGRTNVNYDITVKGEHAYVRFEYFVNDGFWDIDFIDEKVLGGLGIKRYQPDGLGPNLERFGGTPYRYLTTTEVYKFKNPGYK